MPKFPSQEQIDTAVAWLGVNEGDGREREACETVALWLSGEQQSRMLKSEARKGGIPVALLRERLGR